MGMIETVRSVVQFKPLETDRTARRLATAANVDDLRAMARRRLPGGVFDYIDGGAEDERALDRNTEAYQRIEWQPRVLRDVSNIDPSVSVLGLDCSIPLILAPTGFTRIADPEGELAVARAAARAGIPYSLSTMGTRTIEEVRDAAPGGQHLFQVYTWKDRGLVAELIARAADAGYRGLLLTVDTAVLGRRERDVRRGFTLPPKIGLETIVDGALHPGWTWKFVNSEPITFSNVAGRSVGDGGGTAVSLAAYTAEQFDQALSWSDIAWLREQWDGPIVLKGIQTVADARTAVEHGVEGIALSNHGGRQLDDAPAIAELIEPVADAVGGRTTIIADGGIRRGSDIVKALALGADAVMAGRAYLYALGAAGEAGVDHLLGQFRAGVERAMALNGTPTAADIDRSIVRWRGGPAER